MFKYPKVIQSHHRSPIPPIKSVVADIHRYDPDLKLIFHESVDQRAQIALFWNESKRLAALYTFPESHIYAEHETSAPDLTTALSPLTPKLRLTCESTLTNRMKVFLHFKSEPAK